MGHQTFFFSALDDCKLTFRCICALNLIGYNNHHTFHFCTYQRNENWVNQSNFRSGGPYLCRYFISLYSFIFSTRSVTCFHISPPHISSYLYFPHIPSYFPDISSYSFVLTCFMSLSSPTPPQLVFCDLPPPLDDVTFGKWPFGKMSGGLRKNSELLPRSWDLEGFRASLYGPL